MNQEVMSALSLSIDEYEDHVEAQPKHAKKHRFFKRSPTSGGAAVSPNHDGHNRVTFDEGESKSYGVHTHNELVQSHDGEDGMGDEEGGMGGAVVPAHGHVENLFVDLSCWCLPTLPGSGTEFLGRTGMWFLANSDQFISSIVVATCQIPEAISYAVIADLPPSSALTACWISNVITGILGGRPGMISSASGLIALLLNRLVHSEITNNDTEQSHDGSMYVFYVVAFAGLLQCLAAFLGLGQLASTFPAPVVVGMVNAMAILILLLQVRYTKLFPLSKEELDALSNYSYVDGQDNVVEPEWTTSIAEYIPDTDWIGSIPILAVYWAEVWAGFMVAMFLPRLTTLFPATLASILVVAAIEFGVSRQFGISTPLLADYGGTQVEYPFRTIFSSIYNLPPLTSGHTWKIIAGYGSAMFATTFTETSISLNVVDRLDESLGPGKLVLLGQGLSNVAGAVLGGMGSSGMVGLSVLADRTYGTTCLSTFMTGVILLLFVWLGHGVIDYVPLAAISGISISIVCCFIQWRSMIAVFTTCLPDYRREQLPPQYNVARNDVLIMIIVTLITLLIDVAAMVFFVMGLAVYLYQTCVDCRARKRGSTAGSSSPFFCFLCALCRSKKDHDSDEGDSDFINKIASPQDEQQQLPPKKSSSLFKRMSPWSRKKNKDSDLQLDAAKNNSIQDEDNHDKAAEDAAAKAASTAGCCDFLDVTGNAIFPGMDGDTKDMDTRGMETETRGIDNETMGHLTMEEGRAMKRAALT